MFSIIPLKFDTGLEYREKITFDVRYCQLQGVIGSIDHTIVSRSMVSVISAVVFPTASRRLMYTVLTQLFAVSICGLVSLHHVQFVGPQELPYATSTHSDQASIGHVILSATSVDHAWIDQLLIVKYHHTGADVST
jgi:hypothetical protein